MEYSPDGWFRPTQTTTSLPSDPNIKHGLNLNDDFAVDFREREISENGDGALTDYTDQEILAMLKDEDTLVLFYTPMGLEVGLNLDGEIVYVTYEDYMDFRNIF